MAARSYRIRVGATSLVAGPLLMSIGDLIHPGEDLESANQVAILFDEPSRWYSAHLLLFIGMLVFVPGILVITGLAAALRPVVGYVARALILISAAALSAIFAFEMLLGRFVLEGADPSTATLLLDTFQSGHVFGAIGPAALAFFVATGLVVFVLVRPKGSLRWPAVTLGLGAALILGEIMSAEVLLSQIGNILVLLASSAFAWHIVRHPEAADTNPG